MTFKNITTTVLVAATLAFTSAQAQESSAFIHKATPASITSSKTILDTAVLNGNSNLILMATHNFNPGGGIGTYADKKLGFRFQSLKWYIFNQDLSAFTANTSYNVFIPGADAYAWTHVSDPGNITQNYTEINDGRINNNPNARVFVFEQLGNYNTAVVGVFYRTSTSKWCIFRQDGTNNAMPANLTFNIIVPKGNTGYKHVVHTADGSTISNHTTKLDHADLNNNPDAIVFVTQLWNPGGSANGVYNNHNVGVYYDNATNKWYIFNEDITAMPVGASFNVIIFRNSVLGTEEFTIAANQVLLQPMPAVAGNTLEVVLGDLISGNTEIAIYDLSGKLMLTEMVEKTGGTQTFSLHTTGLPSGMYVLKVASNGKANAQKLILQ